MLMKWIQTGRATIYDLLRALEHKTVSCEKVADEIRVLEGQNRVEVGL